MRPRLRGNFISAALQVLKRLPVLVQNYDAMLFREALKSGCYNLQKARDSYRELAGGDGKMHHDLVEQYAEVGCQTCVVHANPTSPAFCGLPKF